MDGKKKKNKKKKGGSQSKLAEDVQSASAEEVVMPELDNGAVPQVNHLRQVSSRTDVQSIGVSESDVDLDRHKLYEERFVSMDALILIFTDNDNCMCRSSCSLT